MQLPCYIGAPLPPPNSGWALLCRRLRIQLPVPYSEHKAW